MKLNEYLSNDNLIALLLESGVTFIEPEKVNTMNTLLMVNYGERVLYEKFELITVPEISYMIALVHSVHWQDLIALKASEVNPIYNSSNTITETVTETGNTINTNENVNKVSAMNDDELTVNDGSSSNANENKQGERTRILTDNKTDFNNVYNNLSLSAKNNIINIVIKDIVDFLTLTIY